MRGVGFGKDVRDCAAFGGSLSIERRRAFEDHFMRWNVTLCLLSIAAMPIGRPASAAEDALEKLFIDTCLVNEAGWIGKDQKSVAANCACKAKTEVKLADPAFKQACAQEAAIRQVPLRRPRRPPAAGAEDRPAHPAADHPGDAQRPRRPARCLTPPWKDMVSKLK